MGSDVSLPCFGHAAPRNAAAGAAAGAAAAKHANNGRSTVQPAPYLPTSPRPQDRPSDPSRDPGGHHAPFPPSCIRPGQQLQQLLSDQLPFTPAAAAVLRLLSPQRLALLSPQALEAALPTLLPVSSPGSLAWDHGGEEAGGRMGDRGVWAAVQRSMQHMHAEHSANTAMQGNLASFDFFPANPSAPDSPGLAPPPLFLDVALASGPWSLHAGSDLSAPVDQEPEVLRACTRMLRGVLGGAGCSGAVHAACSRWRQGAESCVELELEELGSGSLHVHSLYLEESDGIMYPALLLLLEPDPDSPGGALRLFMFQGPAAEQLQEMEGLGSTGRGTIGSMGSMGRMVAVQQQSEAGVPLQPGSALASVHNSGGQAALLRGLTILSNVPLIITLLDLETGPVFQNDLSVWYWGALTQPGGSTVPAYALLDMLLASEPSSMQELVDSVTAGLTWKRALQVPVSCNQDSQSGLFGGYSSASNLVGWTSAAHASHVAEERQEQDLEQEQEERGGTSSSRSLERPGALRVAGGGSGRGAGTAAGGEGGESTGASSLSAQRDSGMTRQPSRSWPQTHALEGTSRSLLTLPLPDSTVISRSTSAMYESPTTTSGARGAVAVAAEHAAELTALELASRHRSLLPPQFQGLGVAVRGAEGGVAPDLAGRCGSLSPQPSSLGAGPFQEAGVQGISSKLRIMMAVKAGGLSAGGVPRTR